MPTMGQLLINEALPPELRDYDRVWSKDNVKDVMYEVYKKYPDQYKDINKRLYDVGRTAVTINGEQASIALADFKQSPELKARMDKIKNHVDQIVDNDAIDQEQKNEQIVEYISKAIPEMTDATIEDSVKRNTALGSQVTSGARGNKSQLAQAIVGDLMVADSKTKPIPVPILHGYGEGVDPAEYWAASYGSRKGYIDIQEGTAKAGFFSKQMVGAAHRIRVTEEDCGTTDGLPVDTTDTDSIGSLLSIDIGNHKAGTIIDNDVLRSLKKSHKKMLSRSPITCKAKAGVCRKCAGVREKGHLADIGDNIGISAVQALSAPITQSQLCLAVGTLVRMADRSIQQIESIKPGDMVLASDINGNTFPTEVKAAHSNGMKECIASMFTKPDNTKCVIRCTTNHKVLKVDPGKGRNVIAPLGTPNAHTILVSADSSTYIFSHVGSSNVAQTYDLEIDTDDHLFVLGNGMIVSNSSKHTGGVVGQTAGAVSGFDAINQLVQVPKTFKDAAAISTLDGRITNIEKAPQGGSYIIVGNESHYITDDQTPSVKVGQVVEAGDVMSDGLPNPALLVEHKGIGEGRRLFVNAFQDTLKKSGVSASRRNVELLARGTVNHVEITDVDGPNGSVMGDVIEYDAFSKKYEPRRGSETLAASKSTGRYLEKPTMHYSIGTRVTPSVIKGLKEFGINDIHTHKDPPAFKPKMIRIMDNVSKSDDWQVRMGGFHLGKGLSAAAQRGAESKVTGNQSYIPALAYGKTFGKGPTGEGF